MAVAVFLLNLSVAAWLSTFVLFALERLAVSGTGYGILLGVGAVGGIGGGLLCSRLARRVGTGSAMIASVVLMGLAQALLAIATDAWLAGVALFMLHAAITVWHVLTTSFRQKVIPEDLLGRVNSAYRLLGQGVTPLGAFLGAALVDAVGLRGPLFIAAPLTLVLAAGLVPALRNRSLDAAVVPPGPHAAPD